MAFTYRCVVLIHHDFSLKTICQEIKKVKAWDVTVWSIMVKGYRSFVVLGNCSSKFVLLTEGAQIVNAQTTRAVTRIGI